MTRAGEYSFVYLGELVGIALMFAGFNLTGSERAARRPGRPGAPAAGGRCRDRGAARW